MLIVAYPLYYVLVASFSDPYDVYAGKTFLLPSQFTLKGYPGCVCRQCAVLRFYEQHQVHRHRHHLLGGHDLSCGLPAERERPARTQVHQPVLRHHHVLRRRSGAYLPHRQADRSAGQYVALFLPGVVAVGNVIIVRNFFENNIPRELLEAAEIDGASKWTVFVKMVIPLSRSIMAVMVVYSMVAYWNDWFTALIYLRADQAPLPLVLRNILIKSSTSASQSSMVAGGFAELNKLTEMIKFASIIVAAAPMLIVYPFVQKYFEKGFMAGAVKG